MGRTGVVVALVLVAWVASLLFGAAVAQGSLGLGGQVRVSQMGPEGSTAFGPGIPAVAHNSLEDEYLVVWSGDDTVMGEFEIWGRLLDAQGNPLGGQFRISDAGPDGDAAFDAFRPAVAYNAVVNEYLVVWQGDDDVAPLVEGEQEIFGQRLSADGGEVGANDFRISDGGPNGMAGFAAVDPAVAYGAGENEYLVVWSGTDDVPPLVAGEIEVFGQRLSASGSEVGPNDFRISDMGPNGNVSFDGMFPDVAYNSVNGQYLVVWYGEDGSGGLVDGEHEVFGQRLGAGGGELGLNDFRISDMGPDGDTGFSASDPSVAHNPAANEYLVVWGGDDDVPPLVDGEREVFGQRLGAGGGELGPNDFRISDMGPNGDTGFVGRTPYVSYSAVVGEYLVVWRGEDNTPPLVDGEQEVFAQRLSEGGREVGDNDVRVTQVGPDGNTGFLAYPGGVAASATGRGFLVAFYADGGTNPPVDNEFEVYARLADVPAPPPLPPPAPGGGCTITGTEGDDVLVGTNDDDVICGLGGDDVLRGRKGNDRLLGGTGNDTLYGGNGDDTLIGQAGTDRLVAKAGDDVLRGGTDNDRLAGNVGNDRLAGGNGDDILRGGFGNDLLRGKAGNDLLRGEIGDDRLFGQTGDDTLRGGPGTDLANGGPNTDTCHAERTRHCESR